MILDGKTLADKIAAGLNGRGPRSGSGASLAVILVGDNPASEKYVKMKGARAREVGIDFQLSRFDATAAESEIIEAIRGAAAAGSDGIMVQLPLPAAFDTRRILAAIPPEKDVDGLTGRGPFMPATVAGIARLIEHYKIKTDGAVAVVVGRSAIVGRPAAAMLTDKNATVILCHSHTRDLAHWTRQADIIVAATGTDNLITADMVKDGAVLIDAARDIESAAFARASAYTPHIGGVGPMTIISLIENTLEARDAG
ncbi:MAG: bifunctional 5,10-methylenetetrahydrofolate dehydrogenase/5,10-methenyltetrahydrofolate cyclohydrolase [Rickettsiales bacterium]|jgi:methylenetetrahydrofolate dehydrogenase (NADP+)/methenyltetrahydrofolate cyclohydrolase|nr:bifunctional 5,10-methylenetetrahydrofolate dehydrogenase/5,10-methenyltetrahydrofolate cyclohydrolase [Rickettsiales bacterium]